MKFAPIPRDRDVDPERAALNNRIMRYARERGVSYLDAAHAVMAFENTPIGRERAAREIELQHVAAERAEIARERAEIARERAARSRPAAQPL